MAEKAWWASRGVWGGIVAALAGLAGIWGYSIPAEDQGRVVELIVAIVSAGGGVVAVVGRAVAKRPIRRSKTVRKSLVSLLLFSILSVCILASLPGCAATSGSGQGITVEQAKAGAAYLESSVAALQKALDEAKAGGDPAKVSTAQAVLDQAKSASAAFAASLPQGDQVEWDAARSLITTAVSVLGPLAVRAIVAQ